MSWIPFLLLGFGVPGFLVAGLLEGDLWLDIRPPFLLILAVVGFVVGSIVGDRRGRTWMGALLGLALGVAGWIVVALWPRPADRSHLTVRRDRL